MVTANSDKDCKRIRFFLSCKLKHLILILESNV